MNCKSPLHSMSRKTVGYELSIEHGVQDTIRIWKPGTGPQGGSSKDNFKSLPAAGCLLPFALEYSKEMG